MSDDLVAAADAAHALVEASPRAAASRARAVLVDAETAGSTEGRAAALHALGYAQYQLADPEAATTLRRAIRIAERGSLPARAAFARRLLAGIYADNGNARASLREIDRACQGIEGADLGRAMTVRLAVLRNLGRETIDLSFCPRALAVLRKEGDLIWEARLLQNRGVYYWSRGDPRAEPDLLAARALWESLGARVAKTIVDVILMRLALADGELIEALRRLAAIDTDDLPGRTTAIVQEYGARVLLEAQLLDEGLAALRSAVAILEHARTDATILEARLEIGTLLLAAGDFAEAHTLATHVARSAAARGRHLLSAQAGVLALSAGVTRNAVPAAGLRSARRAVATFESHGRNLDALRTRVLLARLALAAGKNDLAARELARARRSRARRPVADRIATWEVESILREKTGDHRGAERALRTGLRLLEEYRAALGAVELRAAASGIGVELSRRGLRIAVAAGEPAKVLAWAERLRGNALRLPPVRPSADRQLHASQVELRRVAAELREAEAQGKASRELAARQTELEGAIRARTRTLRSGDCATSAASTLRAAAHALGERALVEYVELDGELRALVLRNGRLVLRELGADTAVADLEWLRFALGRLARKTTSGSQRAAALTNADGTAAALDRLLVEPLLNDIANAPLVIVPTGPLHVLPWGALPSLAARPLVVAPSLSAWVGLTHQRRSRTRRVALVAGPRLRYAAREVRDLAGMHGGAIVLEGSSATVGATLAAIDGAALAHLACHGRFRSDSPLFSSFELADGPLTALDLQRLRKAPDVLVLSSCDLALSERRPGDELLGLSAALLAMGTRTIVASVVPVPDAAVRRLMLSLHREIASGASPATALARARGSAGAGSESIAGFVCLGSG